MPSHMTFDSPKTSAKVRRFLYDALPDGCEGADLIGLNPVSQEVAKAEHSDSERRVFSLSSLFGEFDLYANVLACIWLQLTGLDEEPDPAQVLGNYRVFHDLAQASMLGAFSTLHDTGRIELGEGKK
jgi:hypothetical protein